MSAHLTAPPLSLAIPTEEGPKESMEHPLCCQEGCGLLKTTSAFCRGSKEEEPSRRTIGALSSSFPASGLLGKDRGERRAERAEAWQERLGEPRLDKARIAHPPLGQRRLGLAARRARTSGACRPVVEDMKGMEIRQLPTEWQCARAGR